jgi:GLPGLI family protein
MSTGLKAQLLFNGKITFQRSFNLHKDFKEGDDDDDEDGGWRAEFLKVLPKYKNDIYSLTFTKQRTLYKIEAEDEGLNMDWFKLVTNYSQYTFLNADSTVASRMVYDKSYLVIDSIAQPVWKVTGEYREIAGYMCRRATTIVYDSLFVIAFFTEAIPVSGGPDVFAGLPGMILGVVIPRLNTTIFATKVESSVITDQEFLFKPAKKAKLVNRTTYKEDLEKSTMDWGAKYGARFVLKALF